MDRTIKEWVESGERMLVIVAGQQGELVFQGNEQVVAEVTQDQELINCLKLSFNRPGVAGDGKYPKWRLSFGGFRGDNMS